MNREQKTAKIDEIAAQIEGAEAVFAVDYRGISVPQAAELRAKLREADAAFRVVKNSLTERAADKAGAEQLKQLLEGPTALTFVGGDLAVAAKAMADYARATRLLPFKGGLMNGEPLEPDELNAIAKLPARDVLHGQLVAMVASPVTGLVRTLNAMIQGLAIQLGQIAEKKHAGELPGGEPEVAAADQPDAEGVAEPAAPAEAQPAEQAAPASEAQTPEAEPATEAAPAEQADAPADQADAPAAQGDEPPEQAAAAESQPADADAAAAQADEPAATETPAQAPAGDADAGREQAEPETTPAQTQDDKQADASAQADTAEATKEDK